MSHIAGTICIHSEQSGFCDCFIVIILILFVNRQTLCSFCFSRLQGCQPVPFRRYSIVPFTRTVFSFSVLPLSPHVQSRPQYRIRLLQSPGRHSGFPCCSPFLGGAMHQRNRGKRSHFFQRLHPSLLLLPELQDQPHTPGEIHFF